MDTLKKKNTIGICLLLLLALCLAAGLYIGSKKGLTSGGENPGEKIELSEETIERIERAGERGTPALVVSNVEAAKGDRAIVTVSLVNNPGIIGLSMTLSCDESVLELEKVTNGEAFDSDYDMSYSEGISSGCTFMWDSTDVSEEDIQDGVLLVLQFRVKEDAAPGKSPVMMICDLDGTYDREINVVDLDVENGYVTVNS